MQRMSWDNLLCPIRLGAENEILDNSDFTRTQFQRDYDRIIFSSPFRRLQNKTQVFPLPGSVFVHNRLTHSLEVASVGRSLGNNIVKIIQKLDHGYKTDLIHEIPTIVSTACLAHDLGNPPFGHSGEDSIKKYFIDNSDYYSPLVNQAEWIDLINFEGNANAFRLLTQQLNGRRSGGFRLSYAVLASMIKYPYTSSFKSKKYGVFQSELSTFSKIAEKTGLLPLSSGANTYSRHPLVYIVEAADDICYQIMDIEDAHKLGILSTNEVKELYLNFYNQSNNQHDIERITKTLHEVTDANEQISFLRALVISKLITECSDIFEKNYEIIMKGEPIPSLINSLEGSSASAMKKVKEISIDQVYNHKVVVEIELSGYRIIGSLLESFCKAAVNPNHAYNTKVLKLLPNQYRIDSGSNYENIMSILDFISGMTDLYALDLFKILQGINQPGIPH